MAWLQGQNAPISAPTLPRCRGTSDTQTQGRNIVIPYMHRAHMLSVHRGRLMSARRGAAAAPDADDENRVCWAVVASVVSLMLLCGLLSVVPSPRAFAATRAYIIFGAAVVLLLLMLAVWLLARGAVAQAAWREQAAAAAATAPAAAPVRLVRRICACGLADAAIGSLPTFPYEGPAAAAAGAEGEPPPRGSSVMCAVCLEDVRAGEMVRQLPACRHLFHVACVDVWLRTRRTCPLCRCELPPGKATAEAAAAASAPSPDALPPA
ncbi:hypothetical protein ACP70R_043159 [Stipagrostis hirtigluma subsp. patula]